MTDERYLYALVAYIEYNPVQAKMVKTLGVYEYSSYLAFSEEREPIACLKNSFVFEMYSNVVERLEFIEFSYNERILEEITIASNLVISAVKVKKLDEKRLRKELAKANNMSERNIVVYKASKEGFSQHRLAGIVGLSQTQISRVIKKQRA